MNCWWITSYEATNKAEKGIPIWIRDTVAESPIPIIKVGQSGRNRTCVYVPVPMDGAIVDTVRKRLMVARPPVELPDAVALVLISDQSPSRGSWWLDDYVVSYCPRKAENVDIRCDGCGGRGRHHYLPYGHVTPQSLGLVLAEGCCAQGDAGRLGGGPEYLLAVRPCRFSIRRTGRLRGWPAAYNVVVSANGTVTVSDAEVDIKQAAAQAAW